MALFFLGLPGCDEAIQIDEIAVLVPEVGGAAAPGEGDGGRKFREDK
jgi:hypothetical protein